MPPDMAARVWLALRDAGVKVSYCTMWGERDRLLALDERGEPWFIHVRPVRSVERREAA